MGKCFISVIFLSYYSCFLKWQFILFTFPPSFIWLNFDVSFFFSWWRFGHMRRLTNMVLSKVSSNWCIHFSLVNWILFLLAQELNCLRLGFFFSWKIKLNLWNLYKLSSLVTSLLMVVYFLLFFRTGEVQNSTPLSWTSAWSLIYIF